jgi:hypothetical protein
VIHVRGGFLITDIEEVGLYEALNTSQRQKALYHHGDLRAFVSCRGSNFDLGLDRPFLDVSEEILKQKLADKNIPLDTGWVAQ